MKHEKNAPGAAPGFTLVEMLISLGIFAVIVGFVMVNFRQGKQGDEMRLASQIAAGGIRRAQTLAIAGAIVPFCVGGVNAQKTCPNESAGECPGGTCTRGLPKGYGVHFSALGPDNRTMIVFADINGNNAYDAGEELRHDSVSPSPAVTVNAVSPSAAGALDIVFVPPKPSTYFNVNAPDAVGSITLKHSITNDTKTVTINKISGQISAE